MVVNKTSYSVWYAVCLSKSSSAFQKRRRLRRIYQLDKSSKNRSNKRINLSTRNASNATVDSFISVCIFERIHLSRMVKSLVFSVRSLGEKQSTAA